MLQFILKVHFDLFPTKETHLLIMASRGSEYRFLFLLSLMFFCSSSYTKAENMEGGIQLVFHPSRRELFGSLHYKATQHDLVNSPATYPSTPVINPVTTPSNVPPGNSAPTVVTVPATNPIGVTPNPVLSPETFPPATPIPTPNTNPVNPTVPVTNPVTTPVTNPVTTPTTPGGIPGTVPVTNPTPAPVTTNAPAIPGQSWCVAKTGTQEAALQSAIDYACGIGGADCSTIQLGGICYNPDTLQNHASVAFNSYYQKNPSQTSCDFGATAMITNVNPSTGSCVFATLSSSATPSGTIPAPTTASPSGAIPAPTTASPSGAVPISYGAPPTVLNASNPALGGTTTGFGDSNSSSTASTSISNHFRPAIGCTILLITTTITWITVF